VLFSTDAARSFGCSWSSGTWAAGCTSRSFTLARYVALVAYGGCGTTMEQYKNCGVRCAGESSPPRSSASHASIAS
jgi:hypothetical protein